jgi:2-dehydro-3-deoxyphosphogluconate aldolase/(4S)-4-hydroxy-2-oxoglutarate aldolase
MNMQKVEVTRRIRECGAMAVVRVETVERGLEIARGCLDGGIDVLEISYTLPNAGDVIGGIKQEFGDKVVIGAGTVMDATTARLAIMAGAQFVVANCLSEEVATTCNRYQVPYAPGCTTVTEAIHGLEIGAAFIKCFPISDFYGPKLVSVFKTPTPFMPILATGGINLDNLADYMSRGADCCGFGGLLTKGPSADIAKNARAIRDIIDQTRASL